MKKFVSLLLALALCLGLCVPAMAAEFSDVPAGHYAASAIDNCVAKGIVSGYSDGTFKPANPVTKAQFCVMLARAFYPNDAAAYSHLSGTWYMPSVQALSDRGLLEGTAFAPYITSKMIEGQSIARYDMAQIMSNILTSRGSGATEEQKAAARTKIPDCRSQDSRYLDAVSNCYALGILGGLSDGTFGGWNDMNRAQGCVVIDRLSKYVTADTAAPAVQVPAQTPTQTPTTTGQTLANGKAVTEENVLEIIQELLKKYPDGMAWGDNTSRPGTASAAMHTIEREQITASGLMSNVQAGCGGFASLVSDSIFGSGDAAPARKVPLETVRPGDVIILRDANGNHMHYATAASRITGLSEYSTDKTIPVLTVYDGNANDKVRYNDYLLVPKTYNALAGYYVEVWTRYPTDGTAWTGSTSSNSGSSSTTPTTSTTPSNGFGPSTTLPICDFCGKEFTSGRYNENRTRKVCSDCYLADTARASDYLKG